MKNNNKLLMLLLGLAAAPISLHAKNLLTTAPESLLALQGARLHLAPGEILEQGTLLIEGNRIKAIFGGSKAPEGATVIDMHGLDIYAGFIDPFTQYGIDFDYPTPEKSGPVYEIKRIGGNAANAAIHAEKQWANYFSADKTAAADWINNGFTSVHSAKFDGIFRGRGVHVSLADKIANNAVYRSQGNSFLSFDKGSSVQEYPNSLMGAIALIRQTFSDANWYHDNKSRLTNANQIGLLEYNAALDALNGKGQYFIFDTPDLNNQLRAKQLLNEFSLKGALVGNGYEYAKLNELAHSNYSIILPLNYPAAPEVRDPALEHTLSLAELRHWERAPGNGAALEQAGLSFALTLHGIEDKKDFWPRLQKAIKAGLSEHKALAALTTEAAAIAGVDTMVGKLAPGFIADLAVYSGDPFVDGKLVSVFLQGKEEVRIPREALAVLGNYQLSLGDDSVPLEVAYKDGLSLTLDGKPLAIDGDARRLLTRGALPGIPGNPRFSLNLMTRSGQISVGDGSSQPLTLTRIDDKVELGSKEPAAVAKANDFVGKLTMPNVAWGRESLPQAENIHIQGATLWTSEAEGELPDTDIIISKGKILSIGKQLMTPPGYKKIDGQGKFVTAGIVDEHSHIAINGGANEGSDAVTSEVRIGDVVNPDDVSLYRSLAGGVTTAQLLHGSANPIGGQSQLIKLRWGERAEGLKYQGAPKSIKFALGENVKQSNWGEKFSIRFPQSRMGVESVMADAFDAARDYKADLVSFDKLSKAERQQTVSPRPNLRLDAIEEVLGSKRDVHIHSYVQSEILMFMRLAEAYGFRVKAFTHVLEGYKVAKELAAHGAGASTFSDWWAYKFEVYDAIVQNACLMQQQGVLTSLNSDSFEMQRRLNQEAAKSMMYCNMPALDAWKMITINPAKQLGIDQETGSLKQGKAADLVLWDANPLSVYARTEKVWIDGRRFFDREQDSKLAAAQVQERRGLVDKILALDEQDKAGETQKTQQEPQWHCDSHYVAFGNLASRLNSQFQLNGAHQ